ncbi:MAG TPA: hypothetical protein VHN59_01515 [Chitinophagaceae bacterium]|nr:hypothetical protein [Chitinophagaceae bacterium]
MKRENVQHAHTSGAKGKGFRNKGHDKQKKIVPQTGPDTSVTNAGGSMSEGNLSNSRYTRERTRSLHDKQLVMGSDNDGQSN